LSRSAKAAIVGLSQEIKFFMPDSRRVKHYHNI
jgi:hypothetical protein